MSGAEAHPPAIAAAVEDGWRPVVAPGDDLPAALAATPRPMDILQALDAIERTLARHDAWIRDLHLHLFRRASGETGADGEPPAMDLGCWASGPHRSVHRDDRLLQRIDANVEQQWALAGSIFAAPATGHGAMAEYARFMDLVAEFDTGVRRLLGDTWNLLANIDPLTGLGNRAAMLRRLAIECDRHRRHRESCSIALVDLDYFKTVNDTHGHGAGDTVLRSIASLLAASLRPYDAVFRFGGDEFVLCLPTTDLRSAWAIVERLRLRIAAWTIPVGGDVTLSTSMTAGLAALCCDRDVTETLAHADEALYAAKRLGRNRIYVRRS